MSKTVLTLESSWPAPADGKKVVIYGSAVATSVYKQRVTVTGPYIEGQDKPAPRKPFTSNAKLDKGVQFGYFKDQLTNYEPDTSYMYDVKIEYENDGWKSSGIEAYSCMKLGSQAITAVALSEDTGNDGDWNDTIFTLSMFNDSTD